MKDEPLVSVVIATYNMGQYLPDAVESVLNQDWQNLEVIVVDDGSEDNTPESISRYNDDSRFRYLRTQNQGQPKAKNRGLEESRGAYVAFCDADDLWDRDKLKLQMPWFENPNIGVVYSDVSYIDENGKSIEKEQPYIRYSGRITEKLLMKNFIPFGTAIVRRVCFEEHGSFDENLPMGIDWDLWLRFSLHWDFYYLKDRTYTYRLWSGQMSRNFRGRYENAFTILNNFLEKHPGTIPRRIQSRAWSDMYAMRAISLASSEKIFLEPLKDAIKGVRHDILYFQAWKSLVKILIRHV